MIDQKDDEIHHDPVAAAAADEALGGAEADDEAAQLRAQLADAESKALYAAAEVQNVRRRLEAEKQQASQFAAAGFARDMLAVRDHLERALGHVPEGAREDERSKSFIEGIEATLRELDSAFGRHGVTRIEAKGEKLDPNKHQAMIEIPHDAEPGTIVEEMQSGYMMKDRLLRPALVGVAKSG